MLKEGMILLDNDGWIWEVMYDDEKGKFLFYTVYPPFLDGYEDKINWKDWKIIDKKIVTEIDKLYNDFYNGKIDFNEFSILYENKVKEVLA